VGVGWLPVFLELLDLNLVDILEEIDCLFDVIEESLIQIVGVDGLLLINFELLHLFDSNIIGQREVLLDLEGFALDMISITRRFGVFRGVDRDERLDLVSKDGSCHEARILIFCDRSQILERND
jgi:hypothetical protein